LPGGGGGCEKLRSGSISMQIVTTKIIAAIKVRFFKFSMDYLISVSFFV
jgi:hypothetical protein